MSTSLQTLPIDLGAGEDAEALHEVPEGVRYRSVFISDLHLGTPACRARELLEFLRLHPSETLYLVGDTVDGRQLRRQWFWPQSHNDVVQKLLRRARKGCRVVLVPGRHDGFARQFDGHRFGGIEVRNEAVHLTADGRRLWVLHGDHFDGVLRRARWLAYLRSAQQRIKDFECAVAGEARARGYQGVVCGHIHSPQMREIDGTLYCNGGDWVQSLSALVEHLDGRLELVHWRPLGAAADGEAAPKAARAQSIMGT